MEEDELYASTSDRVDLNDTMPLHDANAWLKQSILTDELTMMHDSHAPLTVHAILFTAGNLVSLHTISCSHGRMNIDFAIADAMEGTAHRHSMSSVGSTLTIMPLSSLRAPGPARNGIIPMNIPPAFSTRITCTHPTTPIGCRQQYQPTRESELVEE